MVLMKEGVVVEVLMDIEHEREDSALDEEEWQLLFDLNDRVAELERTIQVWMGQQWLAARSNTGPPHSSL